MARRYFPLNSKARHAESKWIQFQLRVTENVTRRQVQSESKQIHRRKCHSGHPSKSPYPSLSSIDRNNWMSNPSMYSVDCCWPCFERWGGDMKHWEHRVFRGKRTRRCTSVRSQLSIEHVGIHLRTTQRAKREKHHRSLRLYEVCPELYHFRNLSSTLTIILLLLLPFLLLLLPKRLLLLPQSQLTLLLLLQLLPPILRRHWVMSTITIYILSFQGTFCNLHDICYGKSISN